MLIIIKRYVKTVVKNIWNQKITIGHAELIGVILVVKCGGVVVKQRKMHQGVNFQSMNAKMMKTKKKTKMDKMRKQNTNM